MFIVKVLLALCHATNLTQDKDTVVGVNALQDQVESWFGAAIETNDLLGLVRPEMVLSGHIPDDTACLA